MGETPRTRWKALALTCVAIVWVFCFLISIASPYNAPVTERERKERAETMEREYQKLIIRIRSDYEARYGELGREGA